MEENELESKRENLIEGESKKIDDTNFKIR